MQLRSPMLVLAVAFVAIAAACSGSDSSATTTLGTLPPATTAAPATTTTMPSTTTLPPVAYTVTGDVAAGITDAAAALYSWMADIRNEAPDVPTELRRHLRYVEPPEATALTASASIAELPNGDRVGVVHVGDDILFMVRDGGGWRIVGADLANADPWLGQSPRNLLVVGSDARVGQNQLRYRADSIHILTLATTSGGGTIVGFPRDTYVTRDQIQAGNEVAGLPPSDLPSGGIKWTSLLASRGPEIMHGTAEELSGLEIEGYVITGFKGFSGLISFLGGLVIDLPTTMRSTNDWADFPAGRQTLSVVRALQLARVRKGLPRGDFDRSLNQGRIMLAAMTMVQEMGVDTLPRLVKVLLENAWTDLDTEALFTMAAAAFTMAPEDLTNIVLNGSVGTVSGSSVVFLDDEAAAATFADLRVDGLLEVDDG